GLLLFADPLKGNARSILNRLQTLGINQRIILSGDEEVRVKPIAHQLGITQFQGDLLPDQKLNIIQNLKQTGHHVAMVGDGTNDAPSLASADVAVALGQHGSAISSETAGVVIANDKLSKVADYFVISKKSIHIAKQSIWWGMGLSVLAMISAAFGLIPPVKGAILQEIIDISVILNALRVLAVRV
ncbi:MAG TPA: HAD-IC family P-type ATPase, partial [Gammaproteobacteria bacterium]|nr:HAD-IC family P-type ATPase [Gammaproteobacteria bacterium]